MLNFRLNFKAELTNFFFLRPIEADISFTPAAVISRISAINGNLPVGPHFENWKGHYRKQVIKDDIKLFFVHILKTVVIVFMGFILS